MIAMKTAGLLLAAIGLLVSPQAGAQDYPSRPMRLIIPWPPGGITDVISRGLGAVLTESLGQQVIPDNRPGAAGTLGVAIFGSLMAAQVAGLGALAGDLEEARFFRRRFAEERDEQVVGAVNPLAVVVGDRAAAAQPGDGVELAAHLLMRGRHIIASVR